MLLWCLSLFVALSVSYFPVDAKKYPNFVVIISDDQDETLNGMKPMKKTKKLLIEEGATFSNAYTTTPVCCPSRSSILSGLYLHNHHVLNNSIEGGCSGREWQSLHEPNTFANKLQSIGYTTFYAGKYLNQYGTKKAGGAQHIPPGWNNWIGLVGNSKYYNYTLSVNGKEYYHKNFYLTRALRSHAVDFIEKLKRNKPFLMMIAPPAPHAPFTPEPKYQGTFRGKKIPRTTQFNWHKNEGKHWLAKMPPSPLSEDTVDFLDCVYASRLETVLSIDDLVESVVKRLTERKLIDNTYIFYVSDHGFHFGQFSLPYDKRLPYEFDIRIPFIIRGPGIPRNITILDPVLLLDIAPTILKLTGFDTNYLDGKPIFPFERMSPRTFLIEYRGEKELNTKMSDCWPQDGNVYGCLKAMECKCQDALNNTYTCLKLMDSETNFIYCEFKDDDEFEEAYNLKDDPFQLNNIAHGISEQCKLHLKNMIHEMEHCKGLQCSSHYTKSYFNILLSCDF